MRPTPPVALPCPALLVALPCWLRAAPPCLPLAALLAACRPALPTRRPAGRAPSCSARALPCRLPRSLALPAHRPAGRAPSCPARAPPCPGRAPPCWPSHRPALLERHPAGRRTALHCPLATLLACPPAALPVTPSCCLRAPLLVTRHPALPAMATLSVLTFDHEGRLILFDTWLDNLQLYLLSDSRDSVSLFDHTSGASLAPLDTADSATHSLWLTCDAAARLAVRNHLPLAERDPFGQHKTAKAMYDPVVARYSSPATAALGRLILPYLFPELSAFAIVEDLITHLHTSDTRYRAALKAEFLDKNQPPMDHFLALDPTDLTVDLLEKHLLAAETSIVAVGAACGTPHTPFFEGCSPSPLAPSYASAAVADILCTEEVGAISAPSGKRRSGKGKGGKSSGGGSGGGGGGGVGGGGGGGGSGGGSGGGGGERILFVGCESEGLGFESQCVHFGHPSAGGCKRSTGDPRLILGKGYRLVVLGGYGRTDPLLNKPFYPNAATTTAAPTYYTAMASLRDLVFDHVGRPVQFDTWLDDLQLYLLSDSKDSVSLFYLASGAAAAPPVTADSSTRSQWLTRDAAARLAIRNHLPLAECAHFGQHGTAHALYDAVVARYSSPAIAALGRLLLPYLFPELSAFATVEDLVSHLRASDARYRAAVRAEFLERNPPPMDHFLSLDPTSLTVDLLEQHLLAAETSAVAVGASRGTPRPPFFEGYSPSPLAPSYASAAAADVSVPEDVGAASTSAKPRSSKGKGGQGGGAGSGGGGGGSGSGGGGSSGGGGGGGSGGGSGGSSGGRGGSGGSGGSGGGGTGGGGTGARRVGSGGGQRQQQQRLSETLSSQQLREWFLRGPSRGSCPHVIRTGDRVGQTCGRLHTQHRCFSHLDGAWRAEFGDDVELPCWADLLKLRIAIFDLDFDAILSAMYALSVSAEGDCYQCVPPDPGIAAAALGASEYGTLLGTAPAEALHTFTLDSGASRWGPDVAHSSTVLPCPVVASGSLSSLHLPSFSTNLVSTTALQDAMVTTTTPGGQRVSICTCTRTGHHLATFTRRPGSSLYTLTTEPSQVAASAKVSVSGQVAASCSCRLLSHQTLLWHHCLGHPSLPRLRGMHSRLLVSGLPRSLPPLPPLPALPCLPCVKGRQRAAPHSSSFPPTTAPLQTLHMDVWGPARVSGQSRERYFLLAVDDYTRYTTVFPFDLPVLLLHSDRGGEFSSDLLREFFRGEGILQSFTLPDSPQQNGIAERRIGLVMEVARTSMIHAVAPHFLWPFAVQYAAHQLNLWPRVSLPETSPTLRWMGKVGDASVLRFYHPTSRRVLPSQDVMFDESIPFYRLFPYRCTPLAPAALPCSRSLFGRPSSPQGPAHSGVSLVDPLPGPAPIQVAAGSGAARGAASGGSESVGAEPGGAASEGAETGGAKPGGVGTWGADSRDAEPEGVEPGGTASEGAESRGGEPQGDASSRATGAGGAGATGAGGAGVAAGASSAGGAAPTSHGGARTRGTGAARTCGVEGAGVEGPGTGGVGAPRAKVGGTGAGGTGAVDPCAGGAGGTVRLRPYFSQPPLQPASPLPAPSPYTEQCGGPIERREPASRPVSPIRTARRAPRSRPPPVPGTHAKTLRPSSVPLRVSLPAPPESSFSRSQPLNPSFESAAACALVAELLGFAAACRLDYATALVAESECACPLSVRGECALGTDFLEDRQEDFECLAAAVPRFVSMLLALEGDPDAPDIPTTRSYVEAIAGPYSSQWQAAMDAEMASWKSTGTYEDEVPPPGANIVDGMWIFRGVDYFQTFSPSPKMTTLWVLLHISAQRDYELHSLDFITAFLQGSLHKEIWLRRPPGFTGTFPAGTQWSLRRRVYALRQAPREWHDTLRTTLAALGFAPAIADPSLFLRTDTSLPPFYILVYVNDLVFATADTEALTLVKSELQKRHTCTDLGELRSSLGLQITWDRARRTITLTQSHMVHQVLQRFGFLFSSPQPTPLSTSHSLSALPSNESVEPSGPYPELVGCLMYLMTCTRPDLAYPLSLLARYVAPGRHRKVHWDAAKRVLRYFCSKLGMGLVLEGWGPVVLTDHADASWVDGSAMQRSSQGYTFSLGSGYVSWRSTHSSSVLSSSCHAEIYTGAMAAKELRWLTFLLIDLGEQPRSPPVL
ncbi:unnamed protein product, partial [Closterium sp. NIES-53]